MDVPARNDHFTTNGNLSWTDLATTPVTATVGVLSRLSAANIDQYSLVVGMIAARRFQMGEKGRMNVYSALQKLDRVSGWGDLIYFGFGIDNFVRNLDKSDEGHCLVAVLGMLSECCHELHAANVMYEMVTILDPPRDSRPSVSQWLALVKACSGVLASTTFPAMAEVFMKLDSDATKVIRQQQHGPRENQRGCATPKSLAEVLLALGQVTKGELACIEVHGRANAGFIAAVAEWLFDLRVLIRGSKGSILLQHCKSESDAQLILVYTQSPSDESQTADTSAGINTQLQIRARSYYLEDISNILSEPRETYNFFSVGGRLSWSSCLSSTFGDDFQALLSHPVLASKALGSIARVLLGKLTIDVEGAHGDFGESALNPLARRNVGLRTIDTLLRCFPELATLKLRSIYNSLISGEAATAEGDEAIEILERMCCCERCARHFEQTNRVDGSSKKRTYCWIRILQTIMDVAQTLSSTEIKSGLLLSRIGLENAYNDQVRSNFDSYSNSPSSTSSFSRWVNRIAHMRSPHTIREMCSNRLNKCLNLFSHCSAPSLHSLHSEGVSAMADAGVCVFMSSLVEPSTAPDRTYNMIVMPGHIERDNRSYDSISDLPLEDFYSSIDVKEKERYADIVELVRSSVDITGIALRVREGMRHLEAVYEVQRAQEQAAYSFGPARINFEATLARNAVFCQPRQCHKVDLLWSKTSLGPHLGEVFQAQITDEPGLDVADFGSGAVDYDDEGGHEVDFEHPGHSQESNATHNIYWYLPPDDLARCALATAAKRAESARYNDGRIRIQPWQTILQGKVCIDCCLRYASRCTVPGQRVLILGDAYSDRPRVQ